MKCNKCGTELPAGAIYCPKCGAEIQMVSDQSVLEDELLQFLMDDEALQEKPKKDADKESAQAGKEEKEKAKKAAKKAEAKKKKEEALRKKKKRRRIVLVIILAACVLAVLLCYRCYKANTYDSLYRKAQIAYNTGSYEEAEEYLESALSKDAQAAEAWLLLGKVFVALENTENAEECFLKVIGLDPDSSDAYQALLDLYQSAGDYESIVALLESVDESNTEILALFDGYIVSAPEASVEGGTYNESLEIELTSDGKNEIYYTLDGSDPEKSGTLYEGGIELAEEGETTILAVCINADGFCSDVLEVTYEISYDAPDMPTAYPDGGQFTEASTVMLSAGAGTTIFYTWDGTTPTTSSSRYTGVLEIPEGNNILSAIAVDNTTGKTSGVMRSNFIYYPE